MATAQRVETRVVVMLGGADDDLPGVLPRDADASQIDAAIRGGLPPA